MKVIGKEYNFEQLFKYLEENEEYKNCFSKKIFKEAFMNIIKTCNKKLLDAFFNFESECTIFQENNNKYTLKFNCSD